MLVFPISTGYPSSSTSLDTRNPKYPPRNIALPGWTGKVWALKKKSSLTCYLQHLEGKGRSWLLQHFINLLGEFSLLKRELNFLLA